MCGLTGYWRPEKRESSALAMEALARRMASTLVHRGPDDEGVWADENAGIALAHRRLSILDLSPQGHQPMHSACGRHVLVFNGEIYNFAELRDELEKSGKAPAWCGHSDTEVMLAAFAAWGVETALKKFTGMFALALWDKKKRILTLARDRLGEKPLYYGWQNNVFLFASELKALRVHPAFQSEIDRNALTLFLRYSYIPAPYSIYRGISKLMPGAYLSLSAGKKDVWIESYWSLKAVAETGYEHPFAGPEEEAIEMLECLLKQSIQNQRVADVPLGAFLSGGVDSSTVVALMQAQSIRPVKTFTIGFHEAAYDEATYAKAVAQRLGTEHTELYVSPRDALDVIPALPRIYDEPFSDSSQIPTFLVSRLARSQVTVSLSGDGGDELFAGYNRHFLASPLWRRLGWMPRTVRSTLASASTRVTPEHWDVFFRGFNRLLPRRLCFTHPGDKLHKAAKILVSETPEELYLELVSHWKIPAQLVRNGEEPQNVLTDPARQAALPDFEARMMYLDALTYLPDDILVKVDRAAMAVGLETRVPMLDHRLVEFAWRLPLHMKIRKGQGKWLLRQALYRHVPEKLLERPKMGFGVPIDRWLRGPLKEWGEALLAPKRLDREGFFHPAPITQKWREHQTGQRNWSYHLWDVLMFQAWHEHQERFFE
ncbi:MAG: asparagine synthase (glutamine-hydrolyzing) [Azoarcus sp.]|jgi:asparagine synthase (glutamine-hydrolysing)|nr:asparagine synthase (glutamine-hydrolyzing) [Azoarcus sp.]